MAAGSAGGGLNNQAFKPELISASPPSNAFSDWWKAEQAKRTQSKEPARSAVQAQEPEAGGGARKDSKAVEGGGKPKAKGKEKKAEQRDGGSGKVSSVAP